MAGRGLIFGFLLFEHRYSIAVYQIAYNKFSINILKNRDRFIISFLFVTQSQTESYLKPLFFLNQQTSFPIRTTSIIFQLKIYSKILTIVSQLSGLDFLFLHKKSILYNLQPNRHYCFSTIQFQLKIFSKLLLLLLSSPILISLFLI